MQQRDRFLETWQAGQGARGHSGYRPVVRTAEPEEGSWDEAAGRVEEEPGPDGMARGEARGVERPSWVALLGRPWSWRWRWVLGIGAAACVALGVAAMAVPGVHLVYAAAMAACVPVALVTLFCELDTTGRVNGGVATAVTAVGGVGALVLALVLYRLTGIEEAGLAGFVEEPAKGAMLSVLAMASRRFPGIVSGVALGVCVGAGFAIVETFFYAYGFGEDGWPSTWVLIVRGALSPLTHLAWTGALGGAMWAARGAGRPGWRAFGSWVTWGILAAMVLMHCIWNVVGPVEWLAVALWALIFRFVKRGVAEASAWGFRPKGG